MSKKQGSIGMSTTVDKQKADKSVAWKDYLLPTLQDPEEAFGYLQACLEEDYPGVLSLALCDVIEANRNFPFVAYQVICPYSRYLTTADIPRLIDTLKNLDQIHQGYLADLYWLLHLLGETLSHGGVKQFQLKAELSPVNMPEQFKVSPEYQQWEKAAVA